MQEEVYGMPGERAPHLVLERDPLAVRPGEPAPGIALALAEREEPDARAGAGREQRVEHEERVEDAQRRLIHDGRGDGWDRDEEGETEEDAECEHGWGTAAWSEGYVSGGLTGEMGEETDR